MEELQHPPHGPVRGGFVGRRVIPLCLLPTFLLGVTYFLLVEYVLKQYPDPGQGAALLRFGGAGIVLLFSLASLACAVQISDGVVRPLRGLLRVVEGVEMTPAQAAAFPGADAEMRFLFLRVHTLVQQNRSGAQAVQELEELRSEVDGLAKRFRHAQETLRPPEVPVGRPDSAAARLAHEASRYSRRVGGELERLDTGLKETTDLLDGIAAGSTRAQQELDAAAQQVEKIATVWSLRVELARSDARIQGTLGSCFEDFRSALDRLRGAVRSLVTVGQTWVEVREEMHRLRRTLTDWRSQSLDDDLEDSGEVVPSTPGKGDG